MATGNLMKRASTYRKSHPSLSMQDAVKKVAAMDRAGKKPAAKKKAAPRKRATKKKAVGKVHRKKKAAPRKVKIKLKKNKGGISLGISGVAHSKVGSELQHQHSLNSALKHHQALLKNKGLSATEKAHIKREIAHYKNGISASKKHVNALKRSL